jgi:hypothetical protein
MNMKEYGMSMKNIIISFLISVVFLALAVPPVQAAPLAPFTEMADEEYPIRDTVYWEKGSIPILNLLPDVPGAEGIRERFFAYRPEITVQKLYRIALPGSTLSDKALFTEVVNILGSPKTQVGYTYHSATKDEDVVLFKESYISDSRGREKGGFAYTEATLPEKLSYYQYVDEANFSGTVLKQHIEVNGEYLSFRTTNTERMWYSIIPVLKAGGTRTEMLMFTVDDHLYVYSLTQVEEEPGAKKIGVPLHLPTMFGKRMDVMALWLEDRLRERIK